MIRYANRRNLDKWEETLDELEEKLCMEILKNKQVIEEGRNLIKWNRKMISDDKFEMDMMKTLEDTISIEMLKNNENIYMTQREIVCLYNVARKKCGKEKMEYLMILWEMFNKYEIEDMITSHIGEYECVMTGISSALGNAQRYEESNSVARNVIKENLSHRRMGYLVYNLYGIVWNSACGKEIIEEGMIKQLKKCIILCELLKMEKWKEFIKSKLKR